MVMNTPRLLSFKYTKVFLITGFYNITDETVKPPLGLFGAFNILGEGQG
jgi:hypothetical protein